MRKVHPTPDIINERGYYREVLEIVRRPWNYLVIFRPLSEYNAYDYSTRMACYYVGILCDHRKLDECITEVERLFCEDELRVTNSDWHPELMIPIPLIGHESCFYVWDKSPDDVENGVIEYLESQWTQFPTDDILTPTRFDDMIERLAKKWILT